MKISTQWLSQYVKLPENADKVAARETVTGIEVTDVIKPDEGLKKIVVGKTLSVEAHPNSDHLHVCMVDIGEEKPIQIVCGAPNVAKDELVIVALRGSRIAGNEKIKRGKLRGVESDGMLCALQEIGFPESVVPDAYKNGIYVFPNYKNIKVGDSVYSYLGMDDEIMDWDITPNRADTLGMRGAAWEAAAMYDEKPHFEHPDFDEVDEKAADVFSNNVEDDSLTPTYRNRVVRNIKVQPSPLWMQIRLWNNGIKPINNVVDITNYVMLDYGQPMHAYDLDKLGSKRLSVRSAEKGEKIKALNGQKYELTDKDLVVTNDAKPVAIAGIIGGEDTKVTSDTTDVVLEAADFDPVTIRKSAQAHNLRTEASIRFEKGIDISATEEALDAAAGLLKDLASGDVLAGQVVASQANLDPIIVKVTADRINHALGTKISEAGIIDIFSRLGFKTDKSGDVLTVTVPLRRWDISIPADLVEEVGRIYGYDKLPSTLPTGPQTQGGYTPKQKFLRNAKDVVRDMGYDEAISYALTTKDKAAAFAPTDQELTKVAWPMTIDHEYLRLSLISGLLDDISYNHDHHENNVALFEQGRVFPKEDVKTVRPNEVEMIAGAVTGNVQAKDWETKERQADFYDVKGDVEELISGFNKKMPVSFEATSDMEQMHPGQTALIKVENKVIGFVGAIHPNYAKKLGINDTYVFELNLDKIWALPNNLDIYHELPKYPSIERDIAILVPDSIENAALEDAIEKNAGKYLVSLRLFDVYSGKGIKDGYKSMAYNLVFQNPNATLTDKEVNEHFDKVVAALKDEFGAEIR